jgi:dihydroneopterin aldolase
MKQQLRSGIALKDLRLNVQIGCLPVEKTGPQAVSVDMHIQFDRLPNACKSDDLDDTCCYDQLVTLTRDFCKGTSFSLLERLGYTLFDHLKSHLPAGSQLQLRITKLNPPIKDFSGTSCFVCGDGDAAWSF